MTYQDIKVDVNRCSNEQLLVLCHRIWGITDTLEEYEDNVAVDADMEGRDLRLQMLVGIHEFIEVGGDIDCVINILSTFNLSERWKSYGVI